MAAKTTKTAIALDAFQWNGGSLTDYTLPFWAKIIALQTPGTGDLHVPRPAGRGTTSAKPTDWVVQLSTGHIDVMSNTSFNTYFQ